MLRSTGRSRGIASRPGGLSYRPCFCLPNDRGGQAPALRYRDIFFTAGPPSSVGRGPVPRQRPHARHCSSGSPDSEPFVIRRSQTTEGETHIVTLAIAGDRPPRYGRRGVSWQQNGRLHRRARACPSPCFGLPADRGGQAPALRYRAGFLAAVPVPRRAPRPDYVYTLASVNP